MSASSAGAPRAALDRRWVVLQAVVAVGMIMSFGAVMLFVAGEVIVPLVVGAVLFAVPLGLMAVRRRPAAVAIGVIAGLWLVASIVQSGEVLDGLANPAATADFLVTLSFQVFSVAGVAGLVGVLRRAPGRAARYLLATCGLVLVLAAAGSVALALTSADGGPVVAPGQEALVSVEDNAFAPAELVVQAGATVVWEWAGDQEHNVVGDGFESPLQEAGSFRQRFTTAGRYAYVCTVHVGMTGVVEVRG
jgi:plastocyanin